MDAETRDRIARLCTEAGALMEDASVVALTISSREGPGMRQALAQLAESTRRISELIVRASNLGS